MKKIIFIAIAAITLFCGCSTKDTQGAYYIENGSSVKSFNEEVYVWENLNFTTNRVEGI